VSLQEPSMSVVSHAIQTSIRVDFGGAKPVGRKTYRSHRDLRRRQCRQALETRFIAPSKLQSPVIRLFQLVFRMNAVDANLCNLRWCESSIRSQQRSVLAAELRSKLPRKTADLPREPVLESRGPSCQECSTVANSIVGCGGLY
jgi:hypothetical protein